jgi:hypothetical protein
VPGGLYRVLVSRPGRGRFRLRRRLAFRGGVAPILLATRDLFLNAGVPFLDQISESKVRVLLGPLFWNAHHKIVSTYFRVGYPFDSRRSAWLLRRAEIRQEQTLGTQTETSV